MKRGIHDRTDFFSINSIKGKKKEKFIISDILACSNNNLNRVFEEINPSRSYLMFDYRVHNVLIVTYVPICTLNGQLYLFPF